MNARKRFVRIMKQYTIVLVSALVLFSIAAGCDASRRTSSSHAVTTPGDPASKGIEGAGDATSVPAALSPAIEPNASSETVEPETASRSDTPPKEVDTMSSSEPAREATNESTRRTEIATLGAGCFWCVEAVYEQIPGVLDVRSGYMGGHVDHPTYEDVCTKTTGHIEVAEVTFDPEKLSYAKLLEKFWKLHDPTSLDRQGGDKGPQYRSVIFYHSDEQRRIAEESKSAMDRSGAFDNPIVTEIRPAEKFWVAENYHQDYYRLNKGAPYCQAVIRPKLEKLGLEP
ncbi:MAG TPA: peptide-methionine (S)-S-oxide reductase MsrA [Planctomycetota bacterium]|nr:peptide-methionine (S)-S-oxide reductase MsrA [Planctomycetota bacterium]